MLVIGGIKYRRFRFHLQNEVVDSLGSESY